MHIVCPHCTTSYAINPATLGAGGRTVRCSRCKETWLARPEDAIELAETAPAAMPSPRPGPAQSSGPAADDAAAEWEAMARNFGLTAPHPGQVVHPNAAVTEGGNSAVMAEATPALAVR